MRAGTTPNGQPRSTALYEAILRLDNLDDCIRFFEDLCAVTELRTMEPVSYTHLTLPTT